VYATQAFSQNFVGISLNIENLEYGNTGLVSKNVEKLGSIYVPNSFHIKLGNFEAKETENIWLRYLTPYTQDLKSPFVKNI
jgi:hypothetical protein